MLTGGMWRGMAGVAGVARAGLGRSTGLLASPLDISFPRTSGDYKLESVS